MRSKTGLLLGITLAALCLSAAPAMADMAYGDGGTRLTDVLNSITVAPNARLTSVDVEADALWDDEDSHWTISGPGASVATVVVEVAGFAPFNILGIYDAHNPANKVQVFAGSATAGNTALLSIRADGSVELNSADTGIDFAENNFGYYLQSPQGLFYSDTALNPDGADHMVSIQGQGVDTVRLPSGVTKLWQDDEYILAFEDLYGGGDQDFNDFVVMLESVSPVPVPAAFLLGMLGMGVAGLKLRRFA